ncbi:FHA domain-containing protein FhaB/FipA [Salinibacterium hongtaonis]|uniref:FHA domain-containing protein n=1 Tax=Homoserinimonas hongtaonis TaxID=2079791 RepID=A0A2U1T1Z3_9MICO|nr:FHA domain-containing protein [Salinibacterium hongtaonis]AWB88162.1 FHA domain-containing protein [Salinibacterium hongtaonis]PWB97901.1 FHA domain-containing protein [Salinibacterium hongtaonis]
MSELTLLLLRLGFLLILWAFVFAVVYALRSDLFGDRVRRLPAGQAATNSFDSSPLAAAPAAAASPRPTAAPSGAPTGTPKRLVITSGAKAGLELHLGNEPLTIGRSSDSGLVIRDDYTSTHHARLMLWGDDWVIQDLDSTNGTFLEGKRVTTPTPVPVGASVKIGTTTFELRR